MADFVENTKTVSIVNASIHIYDTGFVSEMLISNRVTEIVSWINFGFLCQVITMSGIVSNIINIMCFIKQGFKDPVNVSFLGLAISDLGCVTTLLWSNICLTPAFIAADLPFDPIEFQHITSGCPHAAFSRITSWITALVTVERCLCITSPLQVKSLVTTRRVSTIIVGVFLILMSSVGLVYSTNRLGVKYFPGRNKTLLGIVYTGDRETVEKITVTINNMVVPFSAFGIIIICTTALVIQLDKKTKWRQKSTGTQDVSVSSRNLKVAQMVVIISTLFIVCFTPLNVGFVVMTLVPGLSLEGKHRNKLVLLGGFGVVLESVNSSANILIYYHMSSKYRDVFRQMFCKIPHVPILPN